jgi:tetratricopeptide (TPR) repeat protein
MHCRRAALPLLCLPLLASLSLLPGRLCAEPAAARAKSSDDGALAKGIEEFRFGRFEAAVKLLERALQANGHNKRRCTALLYLGLTHAVTQKQQAAQARFSESIRCDPSQRLDPRRFKPELITLFDAARQQLVGTLRIRGESGATLRVNGKVTTLPAQLSLLAGRHHLELRAAKGQRKLRRTVELAAGRELKVELRWPTLVKAARTSCPPPPRRRLWTWIAAGTAAALAIAGAGVWYAAERQQDDLALRYRDLVAAGDNTTINELRDGIHAKDVAANVLWGIAGGAAIAAVVAYFLEGRAPKPRRASLLIGPGRVALRAAW